MAQIVGETRQSDTVGAPAAVVSRYAGSVLRHHAFQGQSNDCGPCCAAMVINAVSPFDIAADRLARELDRPAWRGFRPVVRRVPRSATFPWGLVDALTMHGLRARWHLRATPDQLRRSLAAGRLPLVAIGGWRPLWGHWVIILGWDPARGWGLGDPGTPASAVQWQDEALFARRWGAFGRMVVEVELPDAAHWLSDTV